VKPDRGEHTHINTRQGGDDYTREERRRLDNSRGERRGHDTARQDKTRVSTVIVKPYRVENILTNTRQDKKEHSSKDKSREEKSLFSQCEAI
jgi:hypothetical protein